MKDDARSAAGPDAGESLMSSTGLKQAGVPVADKSQILIALAEQEQRLRAFGVQRLGLFGSFVRGEQSADSDVDLLVEFRPDCKTFKNFMDLSFFLEELLGREVELVTTDALSTHIGPRILQEAEYVTVSA